MSIKKYFIFLGFMTIAGVSQNRNVDSLKRALDRAKNPIERFDLLNKIAEDYYTSGSGNVDSSSCTQMLRIAQQLNNDSMLAIAYNLVGGHFISGSGDYSKALEYYLKGIPLAEKVNDKRRISSLYTDISVVYFKLNNPTEQIKYLRKAWENLPNQSSPKYFYMLRQVQYNMGRYFYSQGKLDSALHYAQALNETNLYLKSPIVACAAQGLSGRVYYQFGDRELAALNFRRANAISDSIHFASMKFDFKPIYIDFLIKNGEIAEALAQSRQLMQIGIQYKNFEAKRFSAGFLSKIFDLKKNIDSAYYYSRLELAMKDSLTMQNNASKIESLAFSEQIRLIEEQGRLAELTEQRKTNLQYGLIGIGIITFSILFLLLSRSIITSKKAIEFLGVLGLLIVFEFLNLYLHPIIGRMTNHSPVLMLLALVGIAALLVPSHYRIEKWAINKLIEKNKMIRLAAAKKTLAELGNR